MPSVVWRWQHGGLFTAPGFTWMAAYVVFIVLFLIATREECDDRLRVAFVLLLPANACLITVEASAVTSRALPCQS